MTFIKLIVLPLTIFSLNPNDVLEIIYMILSITLFIKKHVQMKQSYSLTVVVPNNWSFHIDTSIRYLPKERCYVLISTKKAIAVIPQETPEAKSAIQVWNNGELFEIPQNRVLSKSELDSFGKDIEVSFDDLGKYIKLILEHDFLLLIEQGKTLFDSLLADAMKAVKELKGKTFFSKIWSWFKNLF